MASLRHLICGMEACTVVALCVSVCASVSGALYYPRKAATVGQLSFSASCWCSFHCLFLERGHRDE